MENEFSKLSKIAEDGNIEKESIVGKISFYDFNGTIAEVMEYSSEATYLHALNKELEFNMGGFKYETLLKTPELVKKVDDLIYGAYGEENPNSLKSYKEKYSSGTYSDSRVSQRK